MPDNGLTEQQRKWMASVRTSLETATGKTLEQWVAVARTCPETAPKARQRWFKEHHGLGQNYCMLVLSELAKSEGATPRDPKAMAKALWADPGAGAIHAALQTAIDALPGAITGQRKTYTTWSRSYAFACARPVKPSGTVRLGLAVTPDADPRLREPAKEGWSERLKSVLVLTSPDQVDEGVRVLLRVAFGQS
ncbi:MAG TPA: DUF4287 domain-containing protein [Caulobacteraceae bacterium]